MASTYPTTIDAFTNPTTTSLLTSPSHAGQHSDLNDAMEAVQTKLAIGNTVIGTYTAYTPTVTGLTLGDGTISSQYCRVNNFVHFFGKVVFGTTTAITAGLSATLPINLDSAIATATGFQVGLVAFRDVSAGSTFNGTGRAGASLATQFFIEVWTATGSYNQNAGVNASTPFTWANTDILSWNLYYKAA